MVMKERNLYICVGLLIGFFFSCNSGNEPDISKIATDSATIALGESSFIQKCSGCHNFRQDGIGPRLGGLTREVSPDWIRQFISDPKKLMASGDERAQKEFKKFHVVMPTIGFSGNDEIDAIIAFLHTHHESAPQISPADSAMRKARCA